MATRAIIEVYGDNRKLLCRIYKHWDGYPDGLGADLKNFKKGMKLVNGIPLGATHKLANGMGDFAAQLISYLKENKAGDVYIVSSCEKVDDYFVKYGVEYLYTLRPRGRQIVLDIEETI